ncbi:FecR family protein [Sphingobacterium tabacisoli]|uniref:FecR family protein n=1 Tax=Sphingobacterium tabacisoli TaxID=2044855 RepID=A0ABW5KZM6_9SPHI|nr:FecR family protein [Sphingobacterium tabacisoli]
MKQETNLKELFSKYLAGRASSSELLQLLDHFQEENDSTYLRNLILAEFEGEEDAPIASEQVILSRVSVALHDRIRGARRKVKRIYWSIGTAAAVLLCVGGWLGLHYGDSESVSSDSMYSTILPGDDRAILHLEDGRVLDLDSLVDDDARDLFLTKDSGGMMTFNTEDLPASQKDIGKRTLSTPRGGQFAVVLADGTKVWLNAESSITFPTQFDKGTRSVEITGEVYFEVAKKQGQPFIVQARQQTITVLGTHFNINAYPDQHIVKTSLIEGRVAVSAGGRQVELRPGQMCLWNEKQGGLGVDNIPDLGSLLAWKEGMFSFDNSNIREIMQTLSRWYDVDVAFEKGDYSDCVFGGMVPKKENIDQVLRILSASQQLTFDIKERRVLVSRFKK